MSCLASSILQLENGKMVKKTKQNKCIKNKIAKPQQKDQISLLFYAPQIPVC